MISYDGRAFRAAGGGDGTIAHYHQEGDLVWAEFAGGRVRRGSLAGICSPDGTLRLAYSMVLAGGEVIAGETTNVPEREIEGHLLLREQWQRFGEQAAYGVSYLEEVPSRRSTPEHADVPA